MAAGFWSKLWQGVKNVGSKVWSSVKKVAGGALNLAGKAGGFIGHGLEAIGIPGAGAIGEKVQTIAQGINNAWNRNQEQPQDQQQLLPQPQQQTQRNPWGV